MKKIAPPQIRTVTCCVVGSEMRGTLNASAIVAKDRKPSIDVSRNYESNE